MLFYWSSNLSLGYNHDAIFNEQTDIFIRPQLFNIIWVYLSRELPSSALNTTYFHSKDIISSKTCGLTSIYLDFVVRFQT